MYRQTVERELSQKQSCRKLQVRTYLLCLYFKMSKDNVGLDCVAGREILRERP